MKRGIQQLKNYWLRQERPTLVEEERVERNYMSAFDLMEELKMKPEPNIGNPLWPTSSP
jgi:hypothetical protein